MGGSCLPVFLPGEEEDHAFSRVPPVGGSMVERGCGLCCAIYTEQLELFSTLELWDPSQVDAL